VPATRQALVEHGLEAIKAADPGFDVAAFESSARAAFLSVKQAWQELDIARVTGYLSDALTLTLQSQVDDMRRQGVRNVLEGLEIQDEHIVDAGAGDHIVVRFDALVAHYAVDASGQIVFGDRTRKAFTEFWSFVRPAGSLSGSEATCPNCGAPLQPDATGRCRYCRGVLAGGTSGWRAADIKEELDWV
jgi:predicted lipid-binding transport protein (Tim44 family)